MFQAYLSTVFLIFGLTGGVNSRLEIFFGGVALVVVLFFVFHFLVKREKADTDEMQEEEDKEDVDRL